jgi:maltoporin
MPYGFSRIIGVTPLRVSSTRPRETSADLTNPDDAPPVEGAAQPTPMKPTHKRLTAVGRIAGLLTLGACALATPAFAQSTSDIEALRAEIKASREAYETRISTLEKRLADLEKVPATTTASPAVEQRLTALEKSTTEANKALDEVFSPGFIAAGLPKDVTRNLEIHGYLRSGYGINQNGGGQEKVTSPDGLFQIGPGRLGDEEDTYGELTFKYSAPQETADSVKFAVQSTLAYKYAGDKSNYNTNDGDLLIREAFVTASNVLKTNPEVQFWAGQRFYDRHDIHIYDYYFLDTSGYGGGVENIKLGPGKLAVAYLGGTDSTAQVASRYSLTKQILDVRWSELPTFGGKGTLWVSPQYVNGGTGVNPDKVGGLALGWVQMNTLPKGYNKASIQYGFGAGYQFGTYVSGINYQPKGTLDDAKTFQITDQLVWQFDDQFSLMWAAILNYEDKGYQNAGESSADRTFVTTAVRPIYMFTQHIGLETEIGFDWVDDVRWTPEDDSTTVGKITIAPVIKPSGAFWSRPEIRLYATYFFWSDAPSWYAPNGVEAGKKGSWNFGIQAETWW